jgi:hypothetical protein
MESSRSRLTFRGDSHSRTFSSLSRDDAALQALVIFLGKHGGRALLRVVDLGHQRVRWDGDQRAGVNLGVVLILGGLYYARLPG